MKLRTHIKSVVVLLVAVLLAALGAWNIVLKASWSQTEDGVFWRGTEQGVEAFRVANAGPGRRAGILPGDVLLAIDGREALTPQDVERELAARRPGARATYSLLRAQERRALEVEIEPLPRGNVGLFYYLSLAGFFSLVVGTIVALRRPYTRDVAHFHVISVLFFLSYSTSFVGRLDTLDWTIFWIDHVANLLLPVAFLHFALSFPQRRFAGARAWLVPLLYAPAFALAGAAGAARFFFRAGGEGEGLWQVSALLDRTRPLYFGVLFLLAFGALWSSYRGARRLTVRKQMKWLVWGTGAAILPFLVFYAVPFALGVRPNAALELVGYVPLALIPLSLAYAVVKHRLMDVELIFRRALVYTLATGVIVGLCLLAVNLFEATLAEDGPHPGVVATLSTLLVVLLFGPLKSRIQDVADKIFYRERYASRKALLRLSQDLNADLDLERVVDRLLTGVSSALGVHALAVLLPEPDGGLRAYRTSGPLQPDAARVPGGSSLAQRLAAGEVVQHADSGLDGFPDPESAPLAYYFPCRVRGELIAALGVGRREALEPLNSEELDLLQALASQVATALLNGRLYRSLQEKADELATLTEYSESIVESMDAGILVLDLGGRVSRWNRALERLCGVTRAEAIGRGLEQIFPSTFLDALRPSLALGRDEAIANVYKLRLPTTDARSVLLNVSVAPFWGGVGERRGTILIFDDVTARAQLEEQLQHAEKMASIGLLAAGVAHEVNTPLAGISSYTQLLRAQVEDADPRSSLLEKIEKQTFRAARIINNLLNFSRAAGLELESVDVNTVLSEVLSLVEHQLDGNKVKVRRELAESLPPVRGSANRLQQVFFNLILNARDAMPRGGWLTLSTRVDDETIVCEVRDTGIGIPGENVKRIYDPFFTTKGIGRGTGLGLAVSYGIVQEHGGAIGVESTPGVGTTFRVTLPIEAPALPAAQQA